MSLNRTKHSNFFPNKVYRCPCLLAVIDDCKENDLYSLTEIHDEVLQHTLEKGTGKIFVVRCESELKDCIFCCHNCLSVIILGKKKCDCTDSISFDNLTIFFNESKTSVVGKTFCKGCIKYYLRKNFDYFYFEQFELNNWSFSLSLFI